MWQDISTAPKDGTPVLLYGRLEGEVSGDWDGEHVAIGSFLYERWSVDATDYYEVTVVNPTHWQPLPQPPGEENENE